MRNLRTLIGLATQPGAAFAELQESPRFWFPLLLSLLVGVGLILWYYQVVDLEWLLDQSISSNPRAAAMTDAQRAQVIARMSRPVMTAISVVSAVLLPVLMRLLEAGYYMLAGKVTNLERSFRHWFSLSCWSALPLLLPVLPAIVLILLRQSNQFASDVMQPLSLNSLFFHRPLGGAGYTLFTTLTVVHPLAWGLTIVGVHEWSKRSWVYAAVLTLLPVVLCYGLWAAYALRSP